MIETHEIAGRHTDLDALAAKIVTIRRDVSDHASKHRQWQRTWDDMLATHAQARAELAQHPSVFRILVEEVRLDVDVLFYQIARWMGMPGRP